MWRCSISWYRIKGIASLDIIYNKNIIFIFDKCKMVREIFLYLTDNDIKYTPELLDMDNNVISTTIFNN